MESYFGLDEKINSWIMAHPDIDVISITIRGQGRDKIAVIVYE